MIVYFNARPLLAKKTGVGRYCFDLLCELGTIDNIQLKYFYNNRFENTLMSPLQENNKVANLSFASRFFRFAEQKSPHVLTEVAHRLVSFKQGRHFRAGINLEGAKRAVYHEPNFLPLKTVLPTVVTIHDLSILRYPETHPRKRVAIMSKGIVNAIHSADCLITDSEYVRQEILGEFNIDPEGVVSVPLAAAPHCTPIPIEDLPAILGPFDLRPGQYILTVATLEPRKNLMTAFKAYARLSETIRQSFSFIVVGMKGWGTEGANPEIENLIAKGQIRHLGYVPDEVLPALYSGATVFVYPSLYEGFGLPPLEAMACGAPVIVSDRSSLPEVVGDAGVCVDAMDVDSLAEAMQKVIESDDFRTSLKARGIARAAEFSWQRCAQQTVGVYRKVSPQ